MTKIPRSLAIPKSWKTIDMPSLFSAFIYPALGIALLTTMVALGFALTQIELKLWYIPLSLGVIAFTILTPTDPLACELLPQHEELLHGAQHICWRAAYDGGRQKHTMSGELSSTLGKAVQDLVCHMQDHVLLCLSQLYLLSTITYY
jgi:hypothetical protein